MSTHVLDIMKGKVVTPSNYINGKWVPSKTKLFKEVFNPSKNEIIAKTPLSTVDETNGAIQAAKRAFNRWRSTPAQTRTRWGGLLHISCRKGRFSQ
ncbi:MAG: aldehyde dehydrogenase family protein [Candidatus Hodarchaeales archaeon]